jgi:hypothetical protein
MKVRTVCCLRHYGSLGKVSRCGLQLRHVEAQHLKDLSSWEEALNIEMPLVSFSVCSNQGVNGEGAVNRLR